MKLSPLVIFLTVYTQPIYAFDHSHTLYDDVLHSIVSSRGPQTDVDYAALQANPHPLNTYVEMIEAVSKSEYQTWNKDQQLAFLINAYNALTLKLILSKYPDIGSIRDLGGLIFSSPWKKKFFILFGEQSYLDYIEHELIRKDFKEPRIHFVINCASRGCPSLRPEAYIAEKLEQQLEHASYSFLRDSERNRYDADRRRLEISSIFNWFKADFEQAAGSIQKFIAPYISDDKEIQLILANRGASIHFLDYDWSLNDIKRNTNP